MDGTTTDGWDRDLVYVCYCESFECNAATKGAAKLSALGFRVKRLSGGIRAWLAAGYPVEGAAVENTAVENTTAGNAAVGGTAVQGAKVESLHGIGCAC